MMCPSCGEWVPEGTWHDRDGCAKIIYSGLTTTGINPLDGAKD